MTADAKVEAKVLDTQAPAEPLVMPRPKVWGYAPKDGHTWNPLAGWPRNEQCWCGGPRKAKHCCLRTCQKTLTHQAAEGLTNLMARSVYGRALIRQAFQMNAAEQAKTQPEGMTIEGKVEPNAGG